jgi:hypothetical protein
MQNGYRHLISFMDEVHKKYLFTYNFYNSLNKENGKGLTGPARIIEIIKNEIIEKKRNPEDVWPENFELSNDDEFMNNFISNIIEENNNLPHHAAI